MSADNGIYILASPVYEDVPHKHEYRVVHAMAIENIEYKPDREGFNTKELRRYFGKSPVFYDKAEALLEADRMAGECEVLEYGISTITIPFVFPVLMG